MRLSTLFFEDFRSASIYQAQIWLRFSQEILEVVETLGWAILFFFVHGSFELENQSCFKSRTSSELPFALVRIYGSDWKHCDLFWSVDKRSSDDRRDTFFRFLLANYLQVQ